MSIPSTGFASTTSGLPASAASLTTSSRPVSVSGRQDERIDTADHLAGLFELIFDGQISFDKLDLNAILRGPSLHHLDHDLVPDMKAIIRQITDLRGLLCRLDERDGANCRVQSRRRVVMR